MSGTTGKGLFDRTDGDELPGDKLADRVAARAIRQRERTEAELAEARARIGQLESEVDGLEVKAQQLDVRAQRLAGSVRSVVNDPLGDQDKRQGILLNALQRWDERRV